MIKNKHRKNPLLNFQNGCDSKINALSESLGLFGSMRVSRRIANSGLASRREAEKWVEEGRVSYYQGDVISDLSRMIAPDEKLAVDEKLLSPLSLPRIWSFYKPRGCLTTKHDPKGRKRVFDFFPKNLGVIVVGRLDYESEGLLLLTNNGQLSRILEHPTSGFEREYRIRYYGNLPERAENELSRGISVGGVNYRGIMLNRDSTCNEKHNKWATMILKEGKNREIRRILEHYGCQVSRLIRTAYAGIRVGDLKKCELLEVDKNRLCRVLSRCQKFYGDRDS